MRRLVDIPEYVSGALDYTRKDGWYHFSRFYPEQRALCRRNAMYDVCAAMAAGLSLRVRTDAARIEFQVRIEKPAISPRGLWGFFRDAHGHDKLPKRDTSTGVQEPYGACFDCLVDGRYLSSEPAQNGCISFELDNDDERVQNVEIVFPYMRDLSIRDVYLYRCGSAAPLDKRPTVLFLGDSITQGADCVHSHGVWTQKLAAAWDLDLLNQGICGACFDAPMLPPLHALPTPARIVCAYGTNDWEFSSKKTKALRQQNMEAYFRSLAELFPHSPITVITPWHRLDEHLPRTFYDMPTWREKIAKAAGRYAHIEVVSGAQLLPDEAAYYYDGFLHPNDKGAAYMSAQLLESIAHT